MSDPVPSLFEVVRKGCDRSRYQALHWEGSLQQYMEIAAENPGVARNAWQRLLDMVEFHGDFYLSFRSSPVSHLAHPGTLIHILRSADGTDWTEVYTFETPGKDLRDRLNDKG